MKLPPVEVNEAGGAPTAEVQRESSGTRFARSEMFNSIWHVRRYNLPKYNKRGLASEMKSWVKQRRGKLRVQHEGNVLDPLRHTIRTMYSIWVSNDFLRTWLGGGGANLIVCHESMVLYVYTSVLPEGFNDLNEAFMAPYVARNGGTTLDEAPHVVDMSARSAVDKYVLQRDVHATFKKFVVEGTISTQALLLATKRSVSETPDPSNAMPTVAIHLEAEPERAHILSEAVSVPPGVTIKVKRSRTIEHSVDVNWRVSGGGSIDTGFKLVLSASIRGEIEKEQGRAYQESETIEYEVALNGEKSTRYKLNWTDVWRKGVAEYREGGETHLVPFRFREWAELEVLPEGN